MNSQLRSETTLPSGARALLCGVLLVMASAPVAWGGVFPAAAPALVFYDDFETTTSPRPPDDPLDGTGAIWDEWLVNGGSMDFTYRTTLPLIPPEVGGGVWGSRCIEETLVRSGWWGYLIAKQSQPTNPGYVPADWTNIRMELDIGISQGGKPGLVWGMQDPDGDNNPDQGYLFGVRNFPTAVQAAAGYRASWVLLRFVAEGSWSVLGSGSISLPTSDPYTQYLIPYHAYRLRLEWYCSNLRVQIQRLQHQGVNLQFFGCCSSQGGTDPERCWCTLMEWTESAAPLTPGAAGFYQGGRYSTSGAGQNTTLFDNFRVGAWGDTCGLVCDPWSAWTEVDSEEIPFKLLYEGGLVDYSAGRQVAGRKIDVNTSPPAVTSPNNTTTTNYCNGWNLLTDLPVPGDGTDFASIRSFLEPMSSAVDYLSDGAGGFSWQDDFDNDPASPTYNPVPMVADGATPINNSLLDAYDWYIEQVTNGDWADDPLVDCRKWYVVLITDGAESCAGPGEFSCDPGQSASKFAAPENGIEPMQVFTIGFSETVADAPPQLTCISDTTGGQYFGARNASELATALHEVINSLQTDNRSFIPFKVSPPPPQEGAPAEQQHFLSVYPFFQPQPSNSLWRGNLYGFKFDASQPTLPSTPDCEIDVSQIIIEQVSGNAWNSNQRLEAQIAAHTEGNPKRYVFMASDYSGDLERYNLADVATSTDLQTDLLARLKFTGTEGSLEVQEVVNFVRDIWMDDDTAVTPNPRPNPRPVGTSVLGDIYHSQPVVVNPPNRSMFFFDYGYGGSTEVGAHDYPLFMDKHAKRRRVVFAGANDGMLHAFDAGIWDRDRVTSDETYDLAHDLGDGSELFAFVPDAVMYRLKALTYQEEPRYMVDGFIESSDVYIDHDGDGDREWRTIAIATMRRGGRGMTALDVTQPDPLGSAPAYIPSISSGSPVFPGCLNGSTAGCDSEYPKVLWEFKDETDRDSQCPIGTPVADCPQFWDLGWTWSRPAIARIAVYNGATPEEPDDVFIAFFGGGYDETQNDLTGRHIYGVDIETGAVVYTANIGYAVPAGPTALDSDIDGFHDRIYFADSNGGVHRLSFPGPKDPLATGGDAGTLTPIFDFKLDFPHRQEFFFRPITVPAIFDGSDYTWGLALGSGDRADLDTEVGNVDHFFFLLDVGDDVLRDAGDLVGESYDQLDGSYDCTDSALRPNDGFYGWYLSLRPNEKVMYRANVVNGYVLFPTFDPTEGATASHNVPDQCGGSGPSPTPTPDPGGSGDPLICKASGLGRTYKLWFQCGLGDYTESNDFYTGSEEYNIDGTTYVSFTDSHVTPGETEEFPNVAGHIVTNWRQD